MDPPVPEHLEVVRRSSLAFEIPDWFKQTFVSAAHKREPPPIYALEEGDRDALITVLETQLDQYAVRERHVEHFRHLCGKLSEAPESSRKLEAFAKAIDTSTLPFNLFSMYMTLALAHNHSGDRTLRDEFREIHSWWHENHQQYSWALSSHEGLSDKAKRWLAHVNPSQDPGIWPYSGSPLANLDDEREWTVARELLGTLRSELLAECPTTLKSKDLNRPVTVLAVMNYKGRQVAKSVVEDVATSLNADVVFFDASILSQLLGTHLNQTPYWSRGPVSMLGFAARRDEREAHASVQRV